MESLVRTPVRSLGTTMKVGVLMAGLVALVGAIGHWLGGPVGLAIGLGGAVMTNVAMYAWSHRVVLRMYGARTVTPQDAPALHAAVDRLRRRAGLPMPAVAIAPDPQPNAFATGRGHRTAVVCVTQGLLDHLAPDELDGVIAHELAHIRSRDMLLMTITASLAGAVTNIANLAAFGTLFGSEEEEGGNPMADLLLLLVAPIAAVLVQLAISRQREFAADAYAAALTGRPLSLANALAKLDWLAQRSPMAINPAVAPLAQVNPLGGGTGRLVHWFTTHPPTIERVRRLQDMKDVSRLAPAFRRPSVDQSTAA